MRQGVVVKALSMADIDELSKLAAKVFRDDSYYATIFSESNIEEELCAMFGRCARMCLENGYVVGAFDCDTNEMVGFSMLFDFNYVRENKPQFYEEVFPSEHNLCNLSHRIAEYVGRYSEYLYLLSIGVSPQWRRRGICKTILESVSADFGHYNFITDVSNPLMNDILCSQFGFKEAFTYEQLQVLHRLSDVSERVGECYAQERVRFVVPNDFDTELLPELESVKCDIELPHFAPIENALAFRPNFAHTVTVQLVEGTIKTLQFWHRLVNPIFCDEIVVAIDGADALCYIQEDEQTLNPNQVEAAKLLSPQYGEEFSLGTDTITSIPIEYTELDKLVETSKRPRNIQRIMQCLRFRTDYETGMFVDDNDSDSSLSKRIVRRYLGSYSVRLYHESQISFSQSCEEERVISDNLVVGIVASVDSYTSCGVLHLVVLSSNVPISQYLDSASRNQIMVQVDGEVMNLFSLLQRRYSIFKRGSAKNYVSIHEDRKSVDDQMLASLMYSETYYRAEEGLGKVVDPGIMDQVGREMGLAQYNYASAYFHTQLLVQIAPLSCGFKDRLIGETVTMFYVEMVLFEESAIGNMSTKIVDFLTYVDREKPKRIFQNIAALYANDTKSMAFWDIKVNYPSSKVSINLIRDAFQIEKQREQLELKKQQLFSISEVRSNLHSYVESQVVTIVGALLTVISLVDLVLAPDKHLQLAISPLVVLIFILYVRYASKVKHRRNH